MKPSKCALLQKAVKYLGHIVNEHAVATDPDKITALATWPGPENVSAIRTFLGIIGYYHHYVPDFATAAKPLTGLTRKAEPWV